MIRMYFNSDRGTQRPLIDGERIRGINWVMISSDLFPVYNMERGYLGYVENGVFVCKGQNKD